jgi:hypothetical protein
LLIVLARPQPTGAANFTVNSLGNQPDVLPGNGVCATPVATCTLRAAIQEANALGGADTIGFSLTGVISLTGPLPDIEGPLTINGPGAALLTLNANNSGAVLTNRSSADVTIAGLAITGGNGAAVVNRPSGRLFLDRVRVAGNSGRGLINTNATATIIDSTFSGNTGGAILNNPEDPAFQSSFLSLTNSTLSGNSATQGAAILNAKGPSNCELCANAFVSLRNVTIAANTATLAGGGIYTASSSCPPMPFLCGGLAVTSAVNTILEGNAGGNCAGQGISGAGHNLSSDGTCSFVGPNNLVNTSARLGPLQSNGGATQTHALLFGSPAVDAAHSTCPPPVSDQRGVARPQNGDGVGVAICDIGAYELEFQGMPFATVTRTPTGTPVGSGTPTVTPTLTRTPSAPTTRPSEPASFGGAFGAVLGLGPDLPSGSSPGPAPAAPGAPDAATPAGVASPASGLTGLLRPPSTGDAGLRHGPHESSRVVPCSYSVATLFFD